eukprot:PhF_6_TR41667/c0_g1_i1/m.63168/K00326/E1.6.2.2; cytochrome-b5 reductase
MMNSEINPVAVVGLLLGGAAFTFMLLKVYSGDSRRQIRPPTTVFSTSSTAPAPTFQNFTLVQKIPQTHNTVIFRFELPGRQYEALGVPPARHVAVEADVAVVQADGTETIEHVQRTYTPITSDYETSHQQSTGGPKTFDLFIKVYPQGKMSSHLNSLPLGSSVRIKGPTGIHQYLGAGVFTKLKKKLRATNIGMITGGTGVTPMIQLIKHILQDNPAPEEKGISLHGLYANSTLDDVLCRSFLEEAATKYTGRFKLWFTVSRKEGEGASSWPYGVGRVNDEMIRQHMPPPGPGVTITADGLLDVGTLIVVCGPPGLINETVKPALARLGYSEG